MRNIIENSKHNARLSERSIDVVMDFGRSRRLRSDHLFTFVLYHGNHLTIKLI